MAVAAAELLGMELLDLLVLVVLVVAEQEVLLVLEQQEVPTQVVEVAEVVLVQASPGEQVARVL